MSLEYDTNYIDSNMRFEHEIIYVKSIIFLNVPSRVLLL